MRYKLFVLQVPLQRFGVLDNFVGCKACHKPFRSKYIFHSKRAENQRKFSLQLTAIFSQFSLIVSSLGGSMAGGYVTTQLPKNGQVFHR